jgi:LysM repeat protein
MRSSATVFFLISVLWGNAQTNELIIGGQTGNLYLEHTVAPKETWYSVGRLYNVDPKVLAKYNRQTFAKSLGIGQVLKVPLSAANFSQDGKKLATESLVPIYHIVQEKEWLYRISVNHNKVPIPALEKWNHVTGDQVHVGLPMIVGYLKVRTALSALAKGGVVPGVGGVASAGGAEARTPVGSGGGGSGAAVPGVIGNAGTKAAFVSGENRVDTVSSGRKPRVVMEDTPKTVASAPANAVVSAPHFNGGVFKADYGDGGKSASGQAGIFKSSSGWQDGKYYALINSVAVGTIVKITDQASGKSVYAKVLGQLPEMKESAGLIIRLSNAAAAELGEGDGRFGVGLSY